MSIIDVRQLTKSFGSNRVVEEVTKMHKYAVR